MNRGWLLRRWKKILGTPGLVGVALLLAAFLAFFALDVPERLEVEGLHQQVAAARNRNATATANPAAQGTEARLAAFYQEFPARETASSWLEKLHAAGTQTGLSLERVEYKLSSDPATRLLRYEINLPVRGSYVQVREFIRAVMDQVPTMALREMQLQRPNIGEPAVDAQIRFVLYLRDGTT